MSHIATTLQRWVERASKTGYRSLVVVGSDDWAGWIRLLSGLVGGDCLLVSSKEFRGSGRCGAEASPAGIEKVLGGEYSAAILAVDGLIRPSIIAAAGETVRAGGFLALLSRPAARWNPGPEGGRGLYSKYLRESIPRCDIHLWIDEEEGVISEKLEPPKLARAAEDLKTIRVDGVPRALVAAARTPDQARVLGEIYRFARGRYRSLLVRGDRGRGKSYVVGLGLALMASRKMIGRAVVVGPTPLSVQSVMRGLLDGLGRLGIKGVKVRRSEGGDVVRVSGSWFRVSYERPDQAEPAPVTVIDEAAAVGVARVRRLSWRGGKTIVSTTVHGYEGSGRTFQNLIHNILPKPVLEAELSTPIRYRPGDPLERWLYETFLLKAEAPHLRMVGEPNPVRVRAEDLAVDRARLKALYSILVEAHYRNTPDDLLLLLESPNHSLYALEASGTPIAVADVVVESPHGDPEARLALDRLLFMAGASYENIKSWRVSRIAVASGLQRRGYGSRLLQHIEDEARSSGASLVTTIFSRHEVLEFWLKNGYTPYYASPRYNKVTGEKNIALAKPLRPEGRRLLERASKTLARKLVLAGSSVYRDLAAEKIARLLLSTPPQKGGLVMTEVQRRHLEMFLRGESMLESVFDAVFIAIAEILLNERRIDIDSRLLAGIIAKVVQGKPYSEVASILGVGLDEAVDVIDSGLRKLISSYLSKYG
ncbi:MAG: GNAT family N-acetyltransferase [Aeropyrum sp.]|nr:GNAT family N-acetyltransferase [Aeropyrum sp.]